jgi:lysophospholipase L1-like esterase
MRLQEDRTLRIFGVVLIGLGILTNRWLLSLLLAPDGDIVSWPVNLIIIIVQLIFISLGLIIIYYRRLAATRYLADGLIGLLVAIGCSIILDRGLALAGYPTNYIPQLTHPAHYSSTVQNLEFTYQFHTNGQGLRYGEVPLEKAASTTRFVVVGDSFTEGVGVEAHQAFSSLLEQQLSTAARPVEFINCGLAATGPMHYARILFHVCLNYEPDAVLIALYANDVVETVPSAEPSHIDAINVKTGFNRILHAAWPRFYTIVETVLVQQAAGTSPQTSHKIDLIATVEHEARRRGLSETAINDWAHSLPPELVTAVNRGEFNGQLLSAGLLRPDYWTTSLDVTGEEADVQYQVMRSILDEMITRLRARKLPVGVIFIPSAFQYSPDYGQVWRQTGTQTQPEWASTETEVERRLRLWAQHRQLPFLNLTPHYRAVVEASPDMELHYPLDGHWTPQGHMVAANQIAKWLKTWLDLHAHSLVIAPADH